MNQLADPPGIGHNLPPLEALIAEEIMPLRREAEEYLAISATALIVDDASCGKVIDLIGKMRDFHGRLRQASRDLEAPYAAALKTIWETFNPLLNQLETAFGPDTKSGLRGMARAYGAKKQAEAEAARAAALAEQRHREEEAEALRRAAEEKTAAGKSGIGDELDAMAAHEAARVAARRAEAIRPEPVRAQLGSLGSRREIAFDIEDPRKLVVWMLKQPMRGNLEQALRTIMGAYLRSVGVAAIEGGVEIPGVRAWVDTSAVVRR